MRYDPKETIESKLEAIRLAQEEANAEGDREKVYLLQRKIQELYALRAKGHT